MSPASWVLDLHYDNFFWLEYLPAQYAKKHGISLQQAKELIEPQLISKQGCLEWYCTDYWSNEFDMNIAEIKAHNQIASKIAFRENAELFLQSLKATGKQVWMLTNAHPDVLKIKTDRLPLENYFDELISSHQLGYAKEDQMFWKSLEVDFDFNKKRSLFVDDSLPVLRSANEYGVGHLRAIQKPDSKKPLKDTEEFIALDLCPKTNGLHT